MPTRKSAASCSKKKLPALAEIPPAPAQPIIAAQPGIPPENNPAATATPIDFTQLPFFNHPGFQEIYAQWRDQGCVVQEFTSVLAVCRYAIKNTEALKVVLEDAFSLYDMTSGKKPAKDLLRSIETRVPPEIFHIEKFIREMADVGPYDSAKGARP